METSLILLVIVALCGMQCGLKQELIPGVHMVSIQLKTTCYDSPDYISVRCSEIEKIHMLTNIQHTTNYSHHTPNTTSRLHGPGMSLSENLGTVQELYSPPPGPLRY